MYERNLILEERKSPSCWYVLVCFCAFTSIHYCIIVSWCSPLPQNINYRMMKPRLRSRRLRLREEMGGRACRRPSFLMGLTLILSVCACVELLGGRRGWRGAASGELSFSGKCFCLRLNGWYLDSLTCLLYFWHQLIHFFSTLKKIILKKKKKKTLKRKLEIIFLFMWCCCLCEAPSGSVTWCEHSDKHACSQMY